MENDKFAGILIICLILFIFGVAWGWHLRGKDGDEGISCYGNNTCNKGLSCYKVSDRIGDTKCLSSAPFVMPEVK
jgi:hypothetical protein